MALPLEMEQNCSIVFLSFVAPVVIQCFSILTCAVLSQAMWDSQDKVKEDVPLSALPLELLQDVVIDALVKM